MISLSQIFLYEISAELTRNLYNKKVRELINTRNRNESDPRYENITGRKKAEIAKIDANRAYSLNDKAEGSDTNSANNRLNTLKALKVQLGNMKNSDIKKGSGNSWIGQYVKRNDSVNII